MRTSVNRSRRLCSWSIHSTRMLRYRKSSSLFVDNGWPPSSVPKVSTLILHYLGIRPGSFTNSVFAIGIVNAHANANANAHSSSADSDSDCYREACPGGPPQLGNNPPSDALNSSVSQSTSRCASGRRARCGAVQMHKRFAPGTKPRGATRAPLLRSSRTSIRGTLAIPKPHLAA